MWHQDLITNFRAYWKACEEVDDPKVARQQLVAKIVDRVFVYDKSVVAIALHGDFGVVLNEMEEAPIQIANAIGVVIGKKTGATRTATGCAQDGADGVRPVLCIVFVLSRRCVRNGAALSWRAISAHRGIVICRTGEMTSPVLLLATQACVKG